MFNNVVRDVRRMITRDNPSDIEKAVEANEVNAYCVDCLARISENQSKRILIYQFRTKPKDWKDNKTERMQVSTRKGAFEFRGQIDWAGGDPDPLGKNSIHFKDNAIKRDTFHAITVRGTLPDSMPVKLGVGVVKKRRSSRQGSSYSGVQIQRNELTGNAEIRIDGGRNVDQLKNNRAMAWIETDKVAWQTGAFEVTIEVADRDKGTFRMLLKTGDGDAVNVIETQYGIAEETTRLLTRGGGGGAFEFFIWVDGSDGTDYKEIRIEEVKLVKSVQ